MSTNLQQGMSSEADLPSAGRLEICPTQILSGKRALQIERLSLRRGGIYVAFGKSSSLIREFLFLIGGLEQSLKHALRPTDQGLAAASPDILEAFADKILLDGEKVYLMEPRTRATHIGFIFENPEWGFLCNSVCDDFRFTFYAAGQEPPPIYQLREYGLYEARFQAPETLSGGEQQRLACAAVIEKSPDLVIADFSSSNIDVQFRNEMLIPWINTSSSRDGTTFVLRGLPATCFSHCDGTIVVTERNARFADPDKIDFPPEERRIESVSLAFEPRKKNSDVTILVADALETARSKAPVSLKLHSGEVKLIIGPNGSGKTSFGCAILGKLPVTKGSYELNNAAHPAMAFQNPEHCLFARTVGEELYSRELLDLCGLDQRAWSVPPLTLPRSKQKLVSILAACEMAGELVLLDEPTIGLDFADQILFQKIINHYSDKAFLIFTHDDALKNLGTNHKVETIDISKGDRLR